MFKEKKQKIKYGNKPKLNKRQELFNGIIKASFDKANYINYVLLVLMQKDCQVNVMNIDDYVSCISDITKDLAKDGNDFNFKKVYDLEYSFQEFIDKVYSLKQNDVN